MAKRDYIRCYTDLLESPKFGRLSAAQRGTWLSLLLHCGLRTPQCKMGGAQRGLIDSGEGCWS